MVVPIAKYRMLYNIGQVMISKREDKTKSWHSLKHKLVGDSSGLAEKSKSHQKMEYSSSQAAYTSTSKCPKGQQ
jgi:hypothetical protein